MASTNETIQPDNSKEDKDLENSKCQINSEETQTPEIVPCAVTNSNSDIVSDVPAAELNDADPQNADGDNCDKDNIAGNGLSDKKLKSEEVTTHPLQESSDCDTNSDTQVTDIDQVQRTNKKNRHVFFPEDGHIVSGYMEPPSPWNDASQCSTEELIDAYKKACERFGVKPLPRLLQQLNVINDFGDRNETLTLRGERLDSKHCETIEEILRRVQFRTFDLENAHLDDEGTVALFDMIEHYESCNRLNISNNRTIGVRGWQACARLMKKTPCLETLEARNCVISEQVMPFFCRSLRLGSYLTVLHLENSIMSGRHLIILAQALKMNDTLLELYLADNKLMPSDGIQLGNLLRYNFTLKLLDVRNNHLQDVGVSHICDGLWEQNLGQGLATIVLWNNQVTYQAMNSLSRALTNTRSLETLNLGHNNITNEGIHRLKDGLLRNKSLLRIGLQAAKISCEGAVALAEFIAESPRLRRIDLRENDIKTGGLMALSLSLKVSHSVTRIDLDKETKRETSMKDYAEQQQRLMNNINNYMQRNREIVRQQEELNEKLQQEQKRQQEEEEEEQPNEEQASRAKNKDADQTLEDTDVNIKDSTSLGRKPDLGSPEEETPADYLASGKSDGQSQLLHCHRPDNLDLNSSRGPHTLDSPAFLCDSSLATFSESLQLESESDEEREARSGSTQVFFPPSPMVSDNGRPTLAPFLGSGPSVISPETPDSTPASVSLLSTVPGSSTVPTEILRKSPCSSPTTKRKFIISRVQEPSKPQDVESPSGKSASHLCDDNPARSVDEGLATGVPSNDGNNVCTENVASDASTLLETVTDSVELTKTGEVQTDTAVLTSGDVGKAVVGPAAEEAGKSLKEVKHSSSEELAASLSPSQEVGGSRLEVSDVLPAGLSAVASDKVLVTDSEDMSRLVEMDSPSSASTTPASTTPCAAEFASQEVVRRGAEVPGATSGSPDGAAVELAQSGPSEISASETHAVIAVTDQMASALEKDRAVPACDNISTAVEPSLPASPVTDPSGGHTQDDGDSPITEACMMPNERTSRTSGDVMANVICDANQPEGDVSPNVMGDDKPSQNSGECTKFTSELSTMNGVCQNIANTQKVPTFSEKHGECDQSTKDNSSPDCSTPEQLDSFERELDAMMLNLSEATSS